MANDQSIETLKGIGEKTAKLFEKVGIRTIDDLLHYYPKGYDTYREPKAIGELSEDETGAVEGFLKSGATGVHINGLSIVQATISDMTGKLRLVWYHMPYLKNTLRPDSHFIFRGRVIRKKNGLTMEQPQMFKPEAYEELLSSMRPVYAQTKGLGNKTITSAVEQALAIRTLERDYLPASLRISNELAEYNFAIEHIHFPANEEDLRFARKRLVYDEFFFFLLAVRHLKEKRQNIRSPFHVEKQEECRRLLKDLPYRLTNAQLRTLEEVLGDLKSGSVMNRLIQGDVGSGKTIIAVLALLAVCENGYQGALMVPTEVLARQHYESVAELFAAHGVEKEVVLITGSMTAKEKRLAYEKVASHEADIIIGTHALIQDDVVFARLALVVTDEQHRFGVDQRAKLSNKSQFAPDILVMTATPIPRTLALTIYGDLDTSMMQGKPVGRKPIETLCYTGEKRNAVYAGLVRQVQAGHQAYVVCALIDESEGVEARSATEVYTELQATYLKNIPCALLHGRLKNQEKEDIMSLFAAGEIKVLITTTVIEVGVNVPNATLMIIENADRFGLAQMHQLRGRVGRGKDQSYCVLLTDNDNKETLERLQVLRDSDNGFFLAEKDLELRGAGQLFGLRQHGLPDLYIADILQDIGVLIEARELAKKAFKNPQMLREIEDALSSQFDERFQRIFYS